MFVCSTQICIAIFAQQSNGMEILASLDCTHSFVGTHFKCFFFRLLLTLSVRNKNRNRQATFHLIDLIRIIIIPFGVCRRIGFGGLCELLVSLHYLAMLAKSALTNNGLIDPLFIPKIRQQTIAIHCCCW